MNKERYLKLIEQAEKANSNIKKYEKEASKASDEQTEYIEENLKTITSLQERIEKRKSEEIQTRLKEFGKKHEKATEQKKYNYLLYKAICEQILRTACNDIVNVLIENKAKCENVPARYKKVNSTFIDLFKDFDGLNCYYSEYYGNIQICFNKCGYEKKDFYITTNNTTEPIVDFERIENPNFLYELLEVEQIEPQLKKHLKARKKIEAEKERHIKKLNEIKEGCFLPGVDFK